MKRWAKGFARRLARGASERIVDASKYVDHIAAIDQCSQIMMKLKYKDLIGSGSLLPRFAEVEFRCFSQNGEDGVLLYLFSLLGAPIRKAVELCAGDGIECNSANLIVNHGWDALLVDGNEESLALGRRFYANCKTTFCYPPTLAHAWVTPENVNKIITDRGFSGEIDLLSLDMDGIDYWIWKAVECIQPRVVVAECNTLAGPDRSVTVPYRPDFISTTPGYAGASLPALVKLAREKGYRLVGHQLYGFNAFFLRSDVGVDLFPEIAAAQCFDHPHAVRCMKGWQNVSDLEWVEI